MFVTNPSTTMGKLCNRFDYITLYEYIGYMDMFKDLYRLFINAEAGINFNEFEL